jgi:D-alanyl-D-alanine carboxypeptidase
MFSSSKIHLPLLLIAVEAAALCILFAGPASPANAADQDKPSSSAARAPTTAAIAVRLKEAYPGLIKDVDATDVVFSDDTRLPLDDGLSSKSFNDWIETPDIEDMFRIPYTAGDANDPPGIDWDPGRARNSAFFAKIYGDCRGGNFAKSLIDVVWLPKKSGQKLKVTKINGVADRLAAVSQELDSLPASFDAYLFPSAGTFNCRVVAGTKNMSAHSYAIAIDIALKHAHYWRWTKGNKEGAITYKNEIPMEIVRIFEKHGFIWGGKWYHYDTMHFEYRPELLQPRVPLVPQ